MTKMVIDLLESLKREERENQKSLGEKLKQYLYENQEEIESVIKYIEEQEMYLSIPLFFDGMLLRVLPNERIKTICILSELVFLSEKLEMEKQTTFKDHYLPELIIFYTKQLARSKEGIITLLKEKNSFVEKQIIKYFNDIFYKSLYEHNSLFLEELIELGFSKNIMEHIQDLEEFTLKNFLKKNNIQKEYLLPGALQKWNTRIDFFLDLPENKKSFVCYYKRDYYHKIRKNHSEPRIEYQKELEDIFHNNFDSLLSEELQRKILYFYGKVKDHTLMFLIKESLKEKELFLEKIEILSEKYFNKEQEKALELVEKHPFICNWNIEQKEFQKRIKYVIDHPEFTYRDSQITFLTKGIDGLIPKFVSPTCFEVLEEPILTYNREVAIINEYGHLEEYNAFSHEESLKVRYPNDRGDVISSLYYGNNLGDIIFMIENKSLIIWMPAKITKTRDETLKRTLDNIERKNNHNKINVSCAYAIPNRWKEYKYLNQGMAMDLEEFKRNLKYFEVGKEEKRVLKKD